MRELFAEVVAEGGDLAAIVLNEVEDLLEAGDFALLAVEGSLVEIAGEGGGVGGKFQAAVLIASAFGPQLEGTLLGEIVEGADDAVAVSVDVCGGLIDVDVQPGFSFSNLLKELLQEFAALAVELSQDFGRGSQR